MPRITCPYCRAALSLPQTQPGQTVACGDCGRQFIPPPPLPPKPPLPVREEDDSIAQIKFGIRVGKKAVRGLAWGCCLGWACLVALGAWASLPRQQSAIQEAALAAMAAMNLIFGYIVARCVDGLTRVNE